MSTRHVICALVASLSILSAGCGDDDGGSSGNPAGTGQGDKGLGQEMGGTTSGMDMGAGIAQNDTGVIAVADLSGPPSGDMAMSVFDMAVDRCAMVRCGDKSRCENGGCECEDGFVEDGKGACVSPKDTDPVTRTKEQLCTRWSKDYPARAKSQWKTEPKDTCDVGALDQEYLQDAVRRTSLFRWLVGLEPVTLGTEYNEEAQHCATAIAATGQLTHNIPENAKCSTKIARSGAGSSNIAAGSSNAAGTVDLYIQDPGASNAKALGHRRWIFSPKMGKTSFGIRGSFSCMKAFDQSNSDAPAVDYIAWPPPGPSPASITQGIWTFSSTVYTFDSGTAVAVKDLATGKMVDGGKAYRADGTYGRVPAMAWKHPDARLAAGSQYEVTVSGLTTKADKTPKSVTYTVRIVSCS